MQKTGAEARVSQSSHGGPAAPAGWGWGQQGEKSQTYLHLCFPSSLQDALGGLGEGGGGSRGGSTPSQPPPPASTDGYGGFQLWLQQHASLPLPLPLPLHPPMPRADWRGGKPVMWLPGRGSSQPGTLCIRSLGTLASGSSSRRTNWLSPFSNLHLRKLSVSNILFP